MFPTEPTAVNNGFGALLKNRNFLFLWVGQLIAQLADKILLVLMIALLENYPPLPGLAENSMYSSLMVAFTIPAVLFGSAGGILVDRLAKKSIMVGSDIIRGVLTLLIPFLPQDLVFLLIVTFAISTVTQFFAPAEQAAIPLLVRQENLTAANALFLSTMMGAIIVGFAIGEPILSWAKSWLHQDYSQALVVAALYFFSAILVQLIKSPERKLIKRQAGKVRVWAEFRDSLSYIKKNCLLRNAMLQMITLYCVFASLTVLAIRLAVVFGLKEKQFGFFLAAAGVGMVTGAAILGHWSMKFQRKPLPLIGFLTMGLVLGIISFVPNLGIALILCGFFGLAASLIAVPMQTLIQQQTPPSMHGKVFGFQNHLMNIGLSLPLAITGPLTDFLGLKVVLVGMSILVCAVGIWAWKNTRSVLQDVI